MSDATTQVEADPIYALMHRHTEIRNHYLKAISTHEIIAKHLEWMRSSGEPTDEDEFWKPQIELAERARDAYMRMLDDVAKAIMACTPTTLEGQVSKIRFLLDSIYDDGVPRALLECAEAIYDTLEDDEEAA